jgi:glycosyltransferase involved in cell wall biosynthesis
MVSCIMPSANRRLFVPLAIRGFLAQDYANKELIIVDDGEDAVRDLVPDDERIRYIRLDARTVLGEKRNRAAAEARGNIIVHWDDDDWNAPWRLRYQTEELLAFKADICGLDRILFYAPKEARAWEYIYPSGQRPWVYGASLAYTKTFWREHLFPPIHVGEDTRFVWADARAKIHTLADSRFLVALVHSGNCSRKQTSDPRYEPRPASGVERLLGSDLRFYSDPTDVKSDTRNANGLVQPISKTRPSALISAALGIGDILRVTPLIRVAYRLGYETDVLLATDYPDVVRLLEGAPEIRRVFHQPSPRRASGPAYLAGLSDQIYEVATFTAWSAPLRGLVRARTIREFERETWLAEGDLHCVERIAHALGWQEKLPEPFAMASNRRFELPLKTVAIHPGCKYEWPWKKWHGFDELARQFPNVVIVGTEEDLRTDNTYFHRPFSWPQHARDFVGKLNLFDTAALLRECAALVSNDSGLMHLGVALGIPTFGIFGITSPSREMIDAPNMFAITKGLSCETPCRQGTWGRRDCEHHLRCLKTLAPEEVFMKMTATLPELKERPLSGAVRRPAASPSVGGSVAKETINLAYYGNVFDASGYGHAARAYIHALYSAGVNLSVTDLGGRECQVEDELVRSLVGRPLQPDFHLFHGIPPFWARRAFPLRNVIAMTVWETDTMPPQWRSILNHAIEVWLPCEFNVSVFSRSLEKPVFKLPHPVFPPYANRGISNLDTNSFLHLRPGQFLFYSIFEWQERKCPQAMLETFLRAFPGETDAVLIIKTNAAAAALAGEALAIARRQVSSAAQIQIRAEAWSEAEIAALHERGDCYISLHRGEGWGYPLFEAARRGKPVIATAYAGPLDYLDTESHELIRHTICSVQQSYAYYHPAMNWAAPDSAHAAEKMRWVCENRHVARENAGKAARQIAEKFSLEAVGRQAYERLSQLLRRTDPAKSRFLDRQSRVGPPVPIPGEWFDADYFEHGLKSNWTKGYHWRDFAGLFRQTAEFLAAMLPEAGSFLDAGCAKGFLVRSLRERHKEAWGFDHSHWAIEHAEELARPFLLCKSAESAAFDRLFDVTLAFSLLENLTEDQAVQFLQRARAWTSQAIVAVVLTCDDESERGRLLADDHDLAHLTLQSRAWWHDRFLQAGWRQDALHRVSQHACQSHPLPARMGWKIFTYAP